MQSNAPSYSKRLSIVFTNVILIELSAAFKDIISLEKFKLINNGDAYENGRHYSKKEYLWEAIKTDGNVKLEKLEKLTKSMFERLMKVIECQVIKSVNQIYLYMAYIYIYLFINMNLYCTLYS